jgi:signal transduction histidine kinase
VQLERDFALLDRATRAEIETLEHVEDVATELPEVDATRRVTELYHAIDLATAQALKQVRDGNATDGRQIYMGQVRFRLANELEPQLENQLELEQKDVASGRDDLAGLLRNAAIFGVGIAGLGILVVLGLALALRRQAGRRDRAIIGAMDEVADGRWDIALLPAAADGRLNLVQAFHGMTTALGTRERELGEADSRLRAEMEARSRIWDEASRDLLAAEERRTQFLADVSHQLRTPLTILRGEADLALRGRPRVADLRQALGRIETQADEMRQLLEDLVAYARTDAESRLHEPAEIRLDEVIAAAVEEGRALAEQREVSVLAAVPGEGMIVEGDARRLKQALLIGLDNAVKHSPPGGHIDVTAGHEAGEIAIRIIDDGPGVDPFELPRVFERFFRGRGEAELMNDGLGIGLPIAKQIVERHGGQISLGNAEGRGAVLEIRLPAREAVA